MIFGFLRSQKCTSIKVLADSGYRDLQKIHANIELPHRKKQELASKRVVVENVIGLLKRFKIIADKYRNRRKRFGLRFNLIAGIHNLGLPK
ncbi:MAG: hypothetical protein PG981_000252 [Wolbachia endosymbiont of Ctenocephalides orientis wCori]|nr:MAG: hypothetical protein PG981_000252 [Wolbachia endosymbiont of Ctenocephalides orientis wCori]